MKTYILAIAFAGLTACSGSTPQEDREELASTKGEWTHAQTDKAIDLYLEGLKQEETLLDKNLELRKQLEFFDENRCARDVLKSRRAEIDSVRARLDDKRAQITRISK